MNIFVCIKQVPDTATKIKLNADQSGIDPTGVKWIISPYDEFAIEEALRFKEKNATAVVTVLSVGPDRVKESIRTGLAMGADNGIHIDLPESADTFMTAKALAAAISKEGQPTLVFLGKEAVDDSSSQVSQYLSHFLKLPCTTVIANIEYSANSLKCKREIEGGAFESIEVSLPAIIAAQKGLNEPRYASLPNIMKAKKKEIKTYSSQDVGVSAADQKIKFKNFELPPPKQAGKKIEGEPAVQAKELARLLREEAKVI